MYTVETGVFDVTTQKEVEIALNEAFGLEYEVNELYDGYGVLNGISFTVFGVERNEIKHIRKIEKEFKARDHETDELLWP